MKLIDIVEVAVGAVGVGLFWHCFGWEIAVGLFSMAFYMKKREKE